MSGPGSGTCPLKNSVMGQERPDDTDILVIERDFVIRNRSTLPTLH